MKAMSGGWGDRGRAVEIHGQVDDYAALVAASRLGSVRLALPATSVWLQVRGASRVHAREGDFHLRRGDWLALDRESMPEVHSERNALTVGLVLPHGLPSALSPGSDSGFFAGHGSMQSGDLIVALRLWREAARSAATTSAEYHVIEPFLCHLVDLQRELHAHLSRCPGRSRNRKRQVFGRMQRARLYLEGHAHRIVKLSELAEITSFSSWYLSKTFHSLYDESPQAACLRLRLERACELLRNTSLAISEVGAACGFENACSFARAFRARYGLTASDYRQRGMQTTPIHVMRRVIPGKALRTVET